MHVNLFWETVCVRLPFPEVAERFSAMQALESFDGSTMTPPVLISYPALLPVYPKLYVQCFHPIHIIEFSESTASPRQCQYQCLPPLSIVRASTLVEACSRTHCAYLRYCSYLNTLYFYASNVSPCSASGKTPSMFSTPSILTVTTDNSLVDVRPGQILQSPVPALT